MLRTGIETIICLSPNFLYVYVYVYVYFTILTYFIRIFNGPPLEILRNKYSMVVYLFVFFHKFNNL